MKQLIIFSVLIFSVFVLKAQVIVNPDGTHGTVAGQHVHNSDGSLSVIHGNHLINQSGDISVIHGSHIIDRKGRTSFLIGSKKADGFFSGKRKKNAKAIRNLNFKRNAHQIDKRDAQRKARKQERRLRKMANR